MTTMYKIIVINCISSYPSLASMYIFHSLKNEMYEYRISNSIVNLNIFFPSFN